MADNSEFIVNYHKVVDDLDRIGRSDSETMWLLGSLVARLVANSKAGTWTNLKRVVDLDSLRALVDTLDSNAASYAAEGKEKPAYVARLLGISLVAGKVADPTLRQRDDLLDMFLDTAAAVYEQSQSDDTLKS